MSQMLFLGNTVHGGATALIKKASTRALSLWANPGSSTLRWFTYPGVDKQKSLEGLCCLCGGGRGADRPEDRVGEAHVQVRQAVSKRGSRILTLLKK